MSKKSPQQAITAERPKERVAGAPTKPEQKPRPTAKPVHPAKRALRSIASLRLTVVLLGGCMVLVFWGTLAQVDTGLQMVLSNYFRSFVAWVPLRVIFALQVPAEGVWTTTIPFPGGWAWGTVLLANLLAAHITRFRTGWKRVGIWTIHIGVIVLMLGELFTGLGAVESRMVIEEGKSSSYLEDHHKFELALIDTSDPNKDKTIAVPESLLKKGERVALPGMPVDAKVIDHMSNSELSDDEADPNTNPATQGAGLRHAVKRLPPVSGVNADQPVDIASAYVELLEKDSGKSLGVWLVTPHLKDQRVKIGDKTYELSLRFQRTYLPYTFQLSKFTHDVYPGTDKPKDYRSHVHINDPKTGTQRDVEIYMNAPLYFQGKTYYQSGVLDPRQGGMRGTILQVVENPAWRLPYLACALVSIGMLIHFGINLSSFSGKQKRAERSQP